MKLFELLKDQQGTYAAVEFAPHTVKALHEFYNDHKIPNMIQPNDFHTTLLYSRTHCPNYVPVRYHKPMVGVPKEHNVWEPKSNKVVETEENSKSSRCLVLKYHCPELYQRHHDLMKEHNATYDYPDFIPHITLSYDIEDHSGEDIPMFDDLIHIIEEYSEPIHE